MQVVSIFFVASFPSGFEQGIVCCFFCAWAHTSLWSSSGLSRECLGCFGDVLGRLLGCFGDVLGRLLGASRRLGRLLGAPGASGDASASQGGSRVLPEHLREALGSSRDALGSILGCFGDVLGSILGLRESVGSGKDAKVEIIVLPKEFNGC